MNKLFPIHTQATGPDHNRQYYTQTWEPIAIHAPDYFIPFQYVRTNTQYFYCGQVINSVETDITNKFRSGTELINTWTASTYATLAYTASDYNIDSLVFTSDYPTESIVSNNFSAINSQFVNFRIFRQDAPYTSGVINIEFRKGSTILFTDVMHAGNNEIAYKITTAGTDYNIKIHCVSTGGSGISLSDALWSCQKCLYEIHNNYLTYFGGQLYSALNEGICTFKFQSSTKLYSEYCNVTSNDAYFNDQIFIRIFSTNVDYAGIYYKGLFVQELYRFGNVRRSAEPQITVTGEERNGVIVQEKVLTATKYKVKIKINEEMMDALTTAVGATILITDQTGKVFTVNNLEISAPDWYRTNGLVTLTFDDNINVYTQNQTDL